MEMENNIAIEFGEWLLKNTTIWVHDRTQRLYYYSGVYKLTDTLFEIFTNEKDPDYEAKQFEELRNHPYFSGKKNDFY